MTTAYCSPDLFSVSPCCACGHELRLIYSLANWREPRQGEKPQLSNGIILTEPYKAPCVFCPGCGRVAALDEWHGEIELPEITDMKI